MKTTKRRDFLACAVAVLALPAMALSATWDKLGCICQKIGAHWTICRQHWKDSTDDDFRKHLCATHGHKPAELASLSRNRLYLVHDVHHEGGSYNDGKLSFVIPRPSKGRRL